MGFDICNTSSLGSMAKHFITVLLNNANLFLVDGHISLPVNNRRRAGISFLIIGMYDQASA